MLRKSLVFLISLVFGVSVHAQDCENYFIYQQIDSHKFTFQGFMVNPAQAMFNWDFGDGNTAVGKIVSHTYASGSNVFEVCLTTTTYDSTGSPCYDTSCQSITTGVPPGCVAYFFSNENPGNPLAWTFTDFSSGDPTSWSWDFGDGTTSTSQSPLHIYEVPGTYNVCLTIYDTIDNCEDEYCEQITVMAPLGDCESDFTYVSNDLITFDFTGYMTDSSQHNALYLWDFGDGNTGSGQETTHTYQLAGAQFVEVCLLTKYTFPSGDTCEYETCRDVYVGNAISCQALFEWEFGPQPLSISFTDISTGGPTSWHWDFGDSTYSVLQNPMHVYNREGVYNVCLTIINDSNQCTSTFCTEVNVNNLPPPIDCYNTILRTPGSNVFTYDFHGEAFSNGNNVSQTTTFTWNFGDGTTATGQDVMHAYGAVGTYAATLTTLSIINGTDTCIAYGYDSVFITNTSYCIGGFVYLDGTTHIDEGQAHLHSYDAINGILVLTQTVDVDNSGYYLFEDVNHGNGLTYYVQADLSQQSAHFGQYIPSYHHDVIHWPDAQVAVEEECPPLAHYDIVMQESTSATTGSGTISGIVYNGDEKNIIENMEVLLFNENMEALMYVYTDENGRFEFTSLANGSYYVYPEMVGIETSGFLVTLTDETQSASLIIIVADGTAVLSVDEYSPITLISGLYPNPASTQLSINLTAEKATNVNISVFNQLGQQMLNQDQVITKGMNKVDLNISSLPESVYYIRLQADEGRPLMRSFIKIN